MKSWDVTHVGSLGLKFRTITHQISIGNVPIADSVFLLTHLQVAKWHRGCDGKACDFLAIAVLMVTLPIGRHFELKESIVHTVTYKILLLIQLVTVVPIKESPFQGSSNSIYRMTDSPRILLLFWSSSRRIHGLLYLFQVPRYRLQRAPRCAPREVESNPMKRRNWISENLFDMSTLSTLHVWDACVFFPSEQVGWVDDIMISSLIPAVIGLRYTCVICVASGIGDLTYCNRPHGKEVGIN